MKQIIVNVSGLSVEEKQRVNEALAKIIISELCRAPRWNEVCSMYAPSSLGHCVRWSSLEARDSTHTPQQVLEMAGMAKQGHVHADLMVQYASIATTAEDPWNYFEIFHRFDGKEAWITLQEGQFFREDSKYRRKPKTHIVHGVEVPDLLVSERDFGMVYSPAPRNLLLYAEVRYAGANEEIRKRGLFYEYTEAGKQAAILHAKAWLGIE